MTVIVCGDHLEPGAAERLGAIAIDGWCGRPEVPEGVTGVLVVAVCRGEYSLGPIQRALRRAGSDPLGVVLLEIGEEDRADESRLGARVVAAKARAAAFAGASPAQIRMVVPEELSRRALLTLAVPAYRAGPAVDLAGCRADSGCAACVRACLYGAITWTGGAIDLDRVACMSCGRCVTACPVGAMVNPTCTPQQLHAEVAALAAATGGRARGAFVCSRRHPVEVPGGWFPLAVPCVGMLPPHWIVAPLLSGLAAVTVAPCSCGVEDDVAERVAGVVEFARAWVEASMLSGRIVAFDAATSDDLFGPTTALNPFGPAGALNPFGALGAADVARALGVPGPVGLTASPLGLVTLDQSTCTGCEVCAVSCPTGALQVLRTGESVEIGFNAAMCTGCGTCLTRCPEVARGAITLRRRVDLDAIESGTRVLVRYTVRSCSRCGGAIATDAVLRRIEEALGDDAVLGSIVDLCLECRGARIAL